MDELFRAAVEGMAQIQKSTVSEFEIKNKKLECKINVDVKSADLTTLLIDFLSEVLTLSQTDRVVFCNASFNKLTETELVGEITSTKVEEFDEDIKAVTYHEANVVKNEKGQWETVIIFDI